MSAAPSLLERLEALEARLLAEVDQHLFSDAAFWEKLDQVAMATANERLRRRAAEGGAE